MLICKDCGHFKKIFRGVGNPYVSACGVANKIDPVDGEKIYQRCSIMRASDGGCGPEGRLHTSYVERAPAAPELHQIVEAAPVGEPSAEPAQSILDMSGANDLLRKVMLEKMDAEIQSLKADTAKGVVTGTSAAMREIGEMEDELRALRMGTMNWALWRAYREGKK